MTEKITVTGAIQKGLTKKGNPFYALTLADGRQNVTCFDKDILEKLNQEIEADVKEDVYQGATQYIVNLPGKQNGAGGRGFNLDFNQRRVALESASHSMGIGQNDGGDILRRADKFLEWMQK